jgi:GNAT superfamily N-acetyltransferase
MWRITTNGDDDTIASMCAGLYQEDPGPADISPSQIRETLVRLRREPSRGRAVVCELDGRTVGYALLISFWSNELGGEVCVIDELFVVADCRSQGLGTALVEELARPKQELWPERPAALALEVTARNRKARALYERLGFEGENVSMRRRLN